MNNNYLLVTEQLKSKGVNLDPNQKVFRQNAEYL